MLGFKRPPVPMHRLDQDTSGCLLFARNPRARAEIQKSFEAGLVEKMLSRGARRRDRGRRRA